MEACSGRRGESQCQVLKLGPVDVLDRDAPPHRRLLSDSGTTVRRVTHISSFDLTFGSKQDNVTTAAGLRLHQIDRRFTYLVDCFSRGSKKYIAKRDRCVILSLCHRDKGPTL